MLDKQLLQTFRNLIAKGQLSVVLNQLVEATAVEHLNEYNELILLSSKYRALEKMELDNRISFENYQKGTNQLLRSLVTMIDAFEENLPNIQPNTTVTLTEVYKLSLIHI